jgi:hypothetical protein
MPYGHFVTRSAHTYIERSDNYDSFIYSWRNGLLFMTILGGDRGPGTTD